MTYIDEKSKNVSYQLLSIECWSNCIVCDKNYKIDDNYNKMIEDYEDFCSVECEKIFNLKKKIKIPLSMKILKDNLDLIENNMIDKNYDADNDCDYNNSYDELDYEISSKI